MRHLSAACLHFCLQAAPIPPHAHYDGRAWRSLNSGALTPALAHAATASTARPSSSSSSTGRRQKASAASTAADEAGAASSAGPAGKRTSRRKAAPGVEGAAAAAGGTPSSSSSAAAGKGRGRKAKAADAAPGSPPSSVSGGVPLAPVVVPQVSLSRALGGGDAGLVAPCRVVMLAVDTDTKGAVAVVIWDYLRKGDTPDLSQVSEAESGRGRSGQGLLSGCRGTCSLAARVHVSATRVANAAACAHPAIPWQPGVACMHAPSCVYRSAASMAWHSGGCVPRRACMHAVQAEVRVYDMPVSTSQLLKSKSSGRSVTRR